MKLQKQVIILGLLLVSAKMFAQDLPDRYQPMLNEIITFFETIRGSNSITKGKHTLSVLGDEKIALRIDHNKQVKNLTFEKVPDEENSRYWVAANELTIDMVNKYEKDLEKILNSLHKLAEKRSKE